MRTKRMTSLLLCLCMVFILLPKTALAAGATDVYVGNVRLTDGQYTSDGYSVLSTAPSDHYAGFSTVGGVATLTLRNFDYSGDIPEDMPWQCRSRSSSSPEASAA